MFVSDVAPPKNASTMFHFLVPLCAILCRSTLCQPHHNTHNAPYMPSKRLGPGLRIVHLLYIYICAFISHSLAEKKCAIGEIYMQQQAILLQHIEVRLAARFAAAIYRTFQGGREVAISLKTRAINNKKAVYIRASHYLAFVACPLFFSSILDAFRSCTSNACLNLLRLFA